VSRRSRDAIDIRLVPAPRARDIANQIQFYRPDIVHLAGHGTIDTQLVHGENEIAEEINATGLTRLIELCADHVRVVEIVFGGQSFVLSSVGVRAAR
jgi:hypothetical protein